MSEEKNTLPEAEKPEVLNEQKPQNEEKATKTSQRRAFFWGLAAAILSGAIWSIFSAQFGGNLGWMAWVVGLVVGLTVQQCSPRRSFGTALMAILLAVVGVMTGKLLILQKSLGEDSIPYQTMSMQEMLDYGGNETQHLIAAVMAAMVDAGTLPDPADAPTWDEYKQIAKENWKAAAKAFAEMSDEVRATLKEKLAELQLADWFSNKRQQTGEWKLELPEDVETVLKKAEETDKTKVSQEKLDNAIADKEELDNARACLDEERSRLIDKALETLAGKTPEERQKLMDEMKQEFAAARAVLHAEIQRSTILSEFGRLDILFLLLGILTAGILVQKKRA